MANGKFGGGNGTTTAPYLVEDAEDLRAINNQISAHFKQVKDIDMTGEIWEGIGSSSISFTGTYEGQGYSINNINIEVTDLNRRSGTELYIGGLFNRINSPSIVQNININNINISCYSPRNTPCEHHIGGFAGRVLRGSKVKNINLNKVTISCSAPDKGSYSAPMYVGGLCASIAGNASGSEPEIKKVSSISVNELNITKDRNINYESGGICATVEGVFDGLFDCHVTNSKILQTNRQIYGIAPKECTDCTVTNTELTGGSVSGIGNHSTITRCHVLNCTLTSIGTGGTEVAAGISQTTHIDNQVYNSSVINTTIVSATGAGGIMSGQGNSSRSLVSGCLVKDVNITSKVSAGVITGRRSDILDTAVINCNVISTDGGCGGISCDSINAGGNSQVIISRCLFSGTVQGTGSRVGGLLSSGNSTSKVLNSFFLGDYVKALGAVSNNVGRISALAHSSNSDNYSLDTSQLILE